MQGDSTGVQVKNDDLEAGLILDFSHRAQTCVRGLFIQSVDTERPHLLVVDVSQDAGQDLQQENTQQQGKILQERSGREVS